MTRTTLLSILHLVAFWPIAGWYVARTVIDSGNGYALAALGTAVALIVYKCYMTNYRFYYAVDENNIIKRITHRYDNGGPMIEIPEAITLSQQLNKTFAGKKVVSVLPKHTPHKLAWYYGNTDTYDEQMKGKTVEKATPIGSFVEIHADEMRILFSEGTNLSYLESNAKIPKKHQLLIGFDDGTYLCSSVQMYGGMGCYEAGKNDNPYYLTAKGKPAPDTEGFTYTYFSEIARNASLQNKSAKAVLATEQRIPGLGNGVLQDILYNAKIHPKRKLSAIDDNALFGLYESIRITLAAMSDAGGRDTEKDLFGDFGGYKTQCSKFNVGKPCPKCGGTIEKKAYMGGSVYYCPGCQPE